MTGYLQRIHVPVNGMTSQIEIFDRSFRALHERSAAAVRAMADERLFEKTGGLSFGESLLRSAAAVEQAFGGITARLWDDPFEWTLPEELATTERILGYFDEVEATRARGFSFFASDADLAKQIPAPEEVVSIFQVLLEALARAEHFQGRALAIFEVLTRSTPSRP